MFTSTRFFLFHSIQSKFLKNDEKEATECDVVKFDHGYKTIGNTDFQVETADNFPLPFNEFINISQDSFIDTVDKYVDDPSLTGEEIRHIEYSMRGQQSSNLW